jgi:hypothetical protein
MPTDTPYLPGPRDYMLIGGQDAEAEAKLHQQIVDHVIGSLRDAELRALHPDALVAQRQVHESLTAEAGEIEARLLHHFEVFPEVLARVLTTHLIDDYMARTGRGKR